MATSSSTAVVVGADIRPIQAALNQLPADAPVAERLPLAVATVFAIVSLAVIAVLVAAIRDRKRVESKLRQMSDTRCGCQDDARPQNRKRPGRARTAKREVGNGDGCSRPGTLTARCASAGAGDFCISQARPLGQLIPNHRAKAMRFSPEVAVTQRDKGLQEGRPSGMQFAFV
jgi:hypothetical protein